MNLPKELKKAKNWIGQLSDRNIDKLCFMKEEAHLTEIKKLEELHSLKERNKRTRTRGTYYIINIENVGSFCGNKTNILPIAEYLYQTNQIFVLNLISYEKYKYIQKEGADGIVAIKYDKEVLSKFIV